MNILGSSKALKFTGSLFHNTGALAVKLCFLISSLDLGTTRLHGSVVLRVAAPFCLLFLTSRDCSPCLLLVLSILHVCSRSCFSLLCSRVSSPISLHLSSYVLCSTCQSGYHPNSFSLYFLQNLFVLFLPRAPGRRRELQMRPDVLDV